MSAVINEQWREEVRVLFRRKLTEVRQGTKPQRTRDSFLARGMSICYLSCPNYHCTPG